MEPPELVMKFLTVLGAPLKLGAPKYIFLQSCAKAVPEDYGSGRGCKG